MKLKFYKLTFLSLCMWKYAQAAIQITNDDISDVIDSCDYTRFDNQLIKLQFGNDILQHNMSNIQKDLRRQRDILSNLERTIKSFPQQIEAMQEKLVQNNKQNIEDLKDFIRKEIQMQAKMLPPPVDDKIILFADMRETLNKHDKMLDEIIKNQNDSLARLNEINLDKNTQALKDTISEKLAIMPQIDDKLAAIENKTVPRNMLTNVISNQENIKSLLKGINLEKHTQALKNIMSEKLAIMPQIDDKLAAIENKTVPRNMLNDVISNQENIKSLLKGINLDKHTQALRDTISEKLAIMPQIDDKLAAIENKTVPSNMLTNVISNQENIKSLLKGINLEKHTQALKNIMSEKLAIMPQIDDKLAAIENKTVPRNMLNDVISNQENIKSLLKGINLDKHTQALRDTISEKLAIMPQIDDKLAAIENKTVPSNMLTNVISNQENIKSLLKGINLEKHTQALKNIMSEKLAIMPQIDDKLAAIENKTVPRNMLNDVISNQENIKSLLKGINLDKHTQALRDTISEKLAIMPQIDDKLAAIENKTVPRNMLTNVISNQENIKSLLKGINLEKHTQALKNIISEKLAIMPQIDVKLNQIQNTTIPKALHLKFYSDVHQYFHKIDATKICLQDDNATLSWTRKLYPSSCADFDANICADNKCPIINYLYGPKPFVVVCNNSVDGGGWTVIQRRINGAVDFYRDWLEYKHGFGDINGEFFIGLEKLHALTSALKPVELLIQLQDFENVTKYAKYNDFQVGNETENYKLIKLGSYTGDAGDSFFHHVGYSFTTKDRDNDAEPKRNCAKFFTGAWWYHDCYSSNLNGKYYQHPTKFYNNATKRNDGISWNKFHRPVYSLKSVQMLIRPRKL